MNAEDLACKAQRGEWGELSSPLDGTLASFDFCQLSGAQPYYLAGRLAQRMRWHLCQAVLLTPDVLDIADLEEEILAALPSAQANISYERALYDAEQRLLGAREQAAKRQWRSFWQARDLLSGVVRQFPSSQKDVERILASLDYELSSSEPSDLVSLHLPEALSASSSASDDELIALVVADYVEPFAKAAFGSLLEYSPAEYRSYIRAGISLERGQCPNDVGHHLRKDSSSRLWPRANRRRPNRMQPVESVEEPLAGDSTKQVAYNPFVTWSAKVYATVDRNVGTLTPEADWWGDLLVDLAQLPAFATELQDACRRGREEFTSRQRRPERFFGFLKLVNDLLCHPDRKDGASSVRPEKEVIITGPFNLRYNPESRELSRLGRQTPVSLPKGELGDILVTLLEAGAKPKSDMDLWPELEGLSRRKREKRKGAKYTQMKRLRKELQPLGIGIARKHYLLIKLNEGID